MRLYVKRDDGTKKYIKLLDSSRGSLCKRLKNGSLEVDGEVFHVSQVFAEKSTLSREMVTILGCLLGLPIGPFGVMIAAFIALVLNKQLEAKEELKVKVFNGSTSQC